MLDKDEMQKIKGGAIQWAILGGILGGIFAFLAGLADGFLNTSNSCSNS